MPDLLTQPDEDKWTPFHLAKLTLDKIKKVPVTIKHLPNGSHYPIEPETFEDCTPMRWSLSTSEYGNSAIIKFQP